MKLILLLISITAINCISVNVTTSGLFYNCSDTCYINNISNIVRWGTPTIDNLLSGLEFNGNSIELTTDNSPQNIGNLTHYNWPINGIVPVFIGLNITIQSNLDSITIPFKLQINETNNKILNKTICPYSNNPEWFGLFNNNSLCCPYYTINDPCSDRIKFITPFNLEYSFIINETQYTLYIDGIQHDGQIRESFITQEKKITVGQIYARLISLCSHNATCNQINQCTLGQCLDGFCQYNYTSLNDQYCEISNNFDKECHKTYCFNGQCKLELLNNITCGPFDCPGICMNGICSYNSTCNDISSSDDNDDTNLLWLLSLLALCCCIPLLCCCLLLPLLCCIPLILLLIAKSIPESAAVKAGTEGLTQALNNPTYANMAEGIDNPMYDL